MNVEFLDIVYKKGNFTYPFIGPAYKIQNFFNKNDSYFIINENGYYKIIYKLGNYDNTYNYLDWSDRRVTEYTIKQYLDNLSKFLLIVENEENWKKQYTQLTNFIKESNENSNM